MKLKNLLKDIKYTVSNHQSLDIEVVSLFKDSREVIKNSLFCAMGKDILDGHLFIQNAIDNGANSIIAEREVQNIPSRIPFVIVEDSQEVFSRISARFFDYPSKEINVIGITGTNGKTTSTYIFEEILKHSGFSPGVIGTVNYRFNDKILLAENTTPHANHYHRILRKMKEDGVTHVISEISSHGLYLKRVNNVDIDAAIFTNLTLDHLDFHKDFEEYYQAKKLLFTNLLKNSSKKNKIALINIDDQYGERLVNEIKAYPSDFNIKTISLSNPKADFIATNLDLSLDRSIFNVICDNEKVKFSSPLIGHHNVTNLLGVISLAILYNLPRGHIVEAINLFKSVPGRLEKVSNSGEKHIFIDYAHTPDALENVLSAIKKLSDKKIITVFGCGGDRDKSKRVLMGNIALKFSDIPIVTSDNPRSENPVDIINDIIRGNEKSGKFILEPDRRSAINIALNLAGKGDIVLIAGKGHEDYQILGSRKIHFSDREVVEEYLNEV